MLNAGSFLSVSKNWKPTDKIIFDLPISLRTEAIKGIILRLHQPCISCVIANEFSQLISDERPEYGSLQAILCGPYLLAGLSHGDWDINAKSATSFADWLTPVPSYYNSQLISLSQESGAAIFFVSNSNNTMKMRSVPQPGTNAAVTSTFRLVLKDGNSSTPSDAIGKLVMLELFDYPGMSVVHYGEGKSLGVAGLSEAKGGVFRLVTGLDGKDSSVSLESEDHEGCFVYSGVDYKSETIIKLSCSSKSSDDDGFKQGASFSLRKGFNEYHPISFVAKGVQRNFLLSPLLSLMDESYNVYFNIHS